MADTPDFSPVIQRNAEWADRFRGSSTNAAQRQRYAQDQAAQADQLLRARAEAQWQQAQTNKTAQDFYFRQQEMNRKEAMDKATLDIRHQQQANKDELLPAQIEATKARASAQTALETARINREARQAQNAARVATDTDQFEQKQNDLLDSAKPGSQAFADATLRNIAAHPFVSADLRKTWLGQAGIKNDPDQLMRDTAQFQDTHNTTLTRDSKGQWEVKLTPKPVTRPVAAKPPESDAHFYKDLKAMVDSYGGEDKVPKSEWARFQARRDAITNGGAPATPGDGATGDTGTTGDTTASPAAPPAVSAAPTSFISPASFPADSDFHQHGDNNFYENQPGTFVSHPVNGFPNAVGTMDIGDGNLKAFDRDGKFVATVGKGYTAPPGNGGIYGADNSTTFAARDQAVKQFDALHSTADDAIKAGANPDAVKARLQQMGGDPARLTYDD